MKKALLFALSAVFLTLLACSKPAPAPPPAPEPTAVPAPPPPAPTPVAGCASIGAVGPNGPVFKGRDCVETKTCVKVADGVFEGDCKAPAAKKPAKKAKAKKVRLEGRKITNK